MGLQCNFIKSPVDFVFSSNSITQNVRPRRSINNEPFECEESLPNEGNDTFVPL